MAATPSALQSYFASHDLGALVRNWWVLLVRGLVTIMFGVLALAWPGTTVLTLALLYGAFALVDGVLNITAAVTNSDKAARNWWLLLVGALSIGAGLIALIWPGITALALIALLGVWALLRGVLEIAGAIALRKEIDNEWLLILGGLLSAIFGLWVLVAPGAGALALAWLIGVYAIVAGALMVAFSFRLRNLGAAR